MIYNADGEILRPIIVHGGNVSGYCQVNYGDMFTFVKSKDGQIDREVVWSVWHAVRRYSACWYSLMVQISIFL